jgi:hypothetical protein
LVSFQVFFAKTLKSSLSEHSSDFNRYCPTDLLNSLIYIHKEMTARFYVHIIESPSPEELLEGITEGRALCSFLDIAQIPYSYNLAVNPKQFHVAMTARVDEASTRFNLRPILHFSTHGGESGIQLTSQRELEEVIRWDKLAEYIRPIHQIIGDIGVCMSCCEGANGVKMAEVIREQDIPFAWIIGPLTKIYLRDAALAFAVFYRRFHCGDSDPNNLLEAMRAASGISSFNIWFGDLAQQQYSQALLQKSLQSLEKL